MVTLPTVSVPAPVLQTLWYLSPKRPSRIPSLRAAGFSVRHVIDLQPIHQALHEQDQTALILIAEWPTAEAIRELLGHIRAWSDNSVVYALVILEAAQGAVRIELLQAGADDVVLADYAEQEITARLIAAKRRMDAHHHWRSLQVNLRVTHEQLQYDIATIQQLQRGLLPTVVRDEIAVVHLATDRLSGDLVQYLHLDEQHRAVIMLDIAGHGIAAAARAIEVGRHLRMLASWRSALMWQPDQLCQYLHKRYPMQAPAWSYFTLLYAVVNINTSIVQLVSAGAPLPWRRRALSGELERLELPVDQPGGYPIGMWENAEYHTTTWVCRRGDALIFHSDGFTESATPWHETFGEQAWPLLLASLSRQGHHSAQALAETMGQHVCHWVLQSIDNTPASRQGRWAMDDCSALVLCLPVDAELTTVDRHDNHVPRLDAWLAPLVWTYDHERGYFPQRQSPFHGAHNDMSVEHQERLRVLIVDDSRAHCDLMARLLTQWGYQVSSAADANAALQVLSSCSIDIVLCDWDMPGTDGMALCDSIRRLWPDQAIYVIMITALADRHPLIESLQRSVDDFLFKPVAPTELRARAFNALRLRARCQRARQDALALNHNVQQMRADASGIADLQQQRLPFMRLMARLHAEGVRRTVVSHTPTRSLMRRDYVTERELGDYQRLMVVLHVQGEPLSASLQLMFFADWFEHIPIDFIARQPAFSSNSRWLLQSPAALLARMRLDHFSEAELHRTSLLMMITDDRDGSSQIMTVGDWHIRVVNVQTIRVLTHRCQQNWQQYNFCSVGEHLQLQAGDCVWIDHPRQGSEPGASSQVRWLGQAPQVFEVCPPFSGIWFQQTEPSSWLDNLGEPLAAWHVRQILDLRSVQHLGEETQRYLLSQGMDEETACLMDLAVVEACSNIVRHGFAELEAQVTELRIVQFSNVIGIQVYDRGAPIDEQRWEAPIHPMLLAHEAPPILTTPEGGLGMHLIQSISDDCRYVSTAQGNYLQIVRRYGEPLPQ